MDRKSEYIDRLLNVIKSLEVKVSLAKQEDTFSFSFFRDSFKKGQEISSLIHELEMLQIEDMKRQMEKLIVILSEEEVKKNSVIENKEVVEPDTIQTTAGASPQINENIDFKADSVNHLNDGNNKAQHHINYTKEEPIETPTPNISRRSSAITLPTYVNPNTTVATDVVYTDTNKDSNREMGTKVVSDVISKKNIVPSVNDIVQAPGLKIDVRRGFSLNDRFYFQRELFNNDREAMNAMMTKLNSFDSYNLIEQYLKANTSWNFDSEDVKSFLDIISKGIN